MPTMLPHVSAVGSDHAAVVCTCRTCSCDAAPQSICRGRRTATACAAHAPMPPTLRGHASRGHGRTACTQEGHRWPMGACPRPGRHDAHVLAADVAVAETGVPALLERVARSEADLDGYMATRAKRVPVASPSRGAAAPPRARYTRPPSRKSPLSVDSWDESCRQAGRLVVRKVKMNQNLVKKGRCPAPPGDIRPELSKDTKVIIDF